jgi:four helix bundle protein
MALKSYRDLIAWQRAFSLAEIAYQVTARFPNEERFGMIAQARRCAISVPSNIAEGYQRGTRKDYIRFLSIAQGSLAELETQLLLSLSRRMTQEVKLEEALRVTEEVSKLLRGLKSSLLKNTPVKPNPNP